MFGLLNIDKPAGVTSRDVVNRVQRLVRPHKVGHAGTLDPLATGILLMCVGRATRLIPFVQQLPKRYLGHFLLGRQSDTEDCQGQVIELPNPPRPTREQLKRALAAWTGEVAQRPPSFSALKVKGRRAYQLARQGIEVDLPPRLVRIDRLELVSYEYPAMSLRVQCGAGTYIRSLGRDLAQSLGTAAIMTGLRREAVGDFVSQESIDPTNLSREVLTECLIAAGQAVAHLDRWDLDADQLTEIAHGRSIAGEPRHSSPEVAAYRGDGQLVAVLRRRSDGRYGPACNFS